MKKIKFQTPTKEQWVRGALNAGQVASFFAGGALLRGAMTGGRVVKAGVPVVKKALKKAAPKVKNVVKKVESHMEKKFRLQDEHRMSQWGSHPTKKKK